MSITYTSWNACNWKAGYTLDWSTDAAVRGRCLLPYAEAVRQAIVERCAVAGVAVPALLATELLEDFRPPYAWAASIQSTVSTLIGSFVNHTDNSGNWHGQATCAPLWTEADILIALGDPARLTPQGVGYEPKAAWIRQCKRIVNLMRWRTRGTTNDSNLWEKRDPPNANGVTYAALVADSAANWAVTPWYGPEGGYKLFAAAWYQRLFGYYIGGSYRRAGKYSDLSWGAYSRSVDFYGFGEVVDSSHIGGGLWTRTFHAQDTTIALGLWSKLDTSSVSSGRIDSAAYGRIDTDPHYPPDGLPVGTEIVTGYQILPRVVANFAVPGGFTFQ